MAICSIKGINKAVLLAALFNASKQLGLGFLDLRGAVPMSEEEAAAELAANPSMYFDYLRGRVMKVTLLGDKMETALYNRDNGPGAAERVIESINNLINH